MELRSRYGLVLLALLGYYGHFFMPVWSLTLAPPAKDAGVMPGMEFLQGFALFDYHYLSIGIIPFIFSGIITQVIRWQAPSLFSRYAGPSGQGELLQRIFLYGISLVAAIVIVNGIPEARFRFFPAITILELLLTVWSIEQLVNYLKPLNIISSPVMLFLGANVLSSITYSVVSLDFGSFGHMDWSYFLLSVALGLATLSLIIWSQFWGTKIVFARSISASGGAAYQPGKVKLLRAGITPVIYSTFILYPLIAWWYGGDPGTLIIEHPIWIAAFISIIAFFGHRLTMLSMPVTDMQDYASKQGVGIFYGTRFFSSLSDILIRLSWRHAIIAALWFTTLILTQSAWKMFAPETLSKIGFVGGIGVVLLVNVISDAKRHYLSLRDM